ncbi:MAG: hypothetical protein KDD67_06625 [Ignavibacteriae bacterium]|nr:hypothetical protein [Ignavibacteriota bacterium]
MFVLTVSSQAQELESGNTGLIFEIVGFGQFGLSGNLAGSTTLVPMSLPQETIFDELLSGLHFPVYGIGVKTFVTDNFVIRGKLGLNYSSETSRTPGFEYHFPMADPASGYVDGILSYSNGVKLLVQRMPNGQGEVQRLCSVLGAEFLP